MKKVLFVLALLSFSFSLHAAGVVFKGKTYPYATYRCKDRNTLEITNSDGSTSLFPGDCVVNLSGGSVINSTTVKPTAPVSTK